MAKKKKKPPAHYYGVLGLTLTLLLIGLVMVNSSSSVLALNQLGDAFFYFKRQVGFAVVGLTIMFLLSLWDYHNLKIPAFIGINAAIILLILTRLFGRVANGSTRWLPIMGQVFQASEFAKLAVVVWAAYVLAKYSRQPLNLKRLIVPLGLPSLLIVVLVLFQPDMGTALAVVFVLFFMLFFAGAGLKDLLGIGLSGLLFSAVFVLIEPYRLTRFRSFLNPWADPENKGYQIIQGLYALGSGGLHGLGLGLSRQKFGYLPAPHTDFIFAVIGEELGIFGTVMVIILFFALTYYGIKTAQAAADKFGYYLAGGITAMITVQALINLGAVTHLLPITGIPLPLISYGGSSLILTLAGLGIILSVARTGGARAARRKKSENRSMRRRDRRARISRAGVGRGA